MGGGYGQFIPTFENTHTYDNYRREYTHTYDNYRRQYSLWLNGIHFTENEWEKYGKPFGYSELDGYQYVQRHKYNLLMCLKQYNVPKDICKLLTKYCDNNLNVRHKK
jgi:hypothetical protein